jgi:hypothetical protein
MYSPSSSFFAYGSRSGRWGVVLGSGMDLLCFRVLARYPRCDRERGSVMGSVSSVWLYFTLVCSIHPCSMSCLEVSVVILPSTWSILILERPSHWNLPFMCWMRYDCCHCVSMRLRFCHLCCSVVPFSFAKADLSVQLCFFLHCAALSLLLW